MYTSVAVYVCGIIVFMGTLMLMISGKPDSVEIKEDSNSTGVLYCLPLNKSRVTGQRRTGSDKWNLLESDKSEEKGKLAGNEAWDLNFGFQNVQ
jgi:hypothetical protein